MKQAIAGVAPPQLGEVTIMTVWPSLGRDELGQLLGRLYSIRLGFGNVLTIGNLIALAAIPLALPLYFLKYAPWDCRRYRLTNRRVAVEKGLQAQVERYLPLDGYDAIDVVVRPGQDWYPCGDLVFRRGPIEALRLTGVLRPETFRQTCLKAQVAFVSVQRALDA
jgi:hypothetical protein